jgi:hypothetical protein
MTEAIVGPTKTREMHNHFDSTIWNSFRFRDGRFAFSREHANWELVRKRGRIKGWE